LDDKLMFVELRTTNFSLSNKSGVEQPRRNKLKFVVRL